MSTANNIIFNELRKELSKKMDYKWRIQSFSKNKPVASCVAYIDARDVMDRLDDVLGPENWQDKYELVGNNLVCGIGIRYSNEWVWKHDTGTSGNIEEEKSLYSDTFKRAAVKWGIGRFLYSLPIEYIDTNAPKSESNKYPYPVDSNKKRIWDVTEYLNNKK